MVNIYIVCDCDWEDWEIVMVFISRALAEQYIATHIPQGHYGFKIEEYPIIEDD